MFDIIDLLSNYFTPTLAIEMLVVGYLYLFVFYFENGEWKYKFSDLDKVVFTIFAGLYFYFIVIFLSVPIHSIKCIFISFKGESFITDPSFHDLVNVYSLVFIIIIAVLIYLKLESIEKNRAEKGEKLIRYFIYGGLGVYFIYLLSIIAFLGNNYYGLIKLMFKDLIFCILAFSSWLFSFYFLHIKKKEVYDIIPHFNRKMIYSIILILFLIILILSPFIIMPSIQKEPKEIEYVEIENPSISYGREYFKSPDKSVKLQIIVL
ncbi:MAG: hypothetical protein GXO65_03695, partial [Euryarchaeota archaeon]|nr:hypothetical protein [Euryarchaeota archaeon]